MPLTEGQVQVGDLIMGRDTSYKLLEFDPWSRQVRADQGAARAWNHGAWSGAEWQAQAVVPMRIRVLGSDAATWLALHQALAAAFVPSSTDVELRWVTGGVEYLLRGRPRMVEPEVRTIGRGQVITKAAFVALDPLIYSGDEHSVILGLPSTTGGLTVPVTAPLTIPATVTSGRATITNAGKAPVGLTLRIDGPVVEPRVSLLTSAGTAIVRMWLTLTAGQWLDIDTAARTVYLNGTASRRGQATGDGIGWPILPKGSAELAFDSPTYSALPQLTATWRDAWY